ncbi:hypothetical protein BDV96DRAFT_118510 [Lophiotrema nucula]|uniref:Zn(2)-C6 fungal-type domain-containing protein n=1 Tax=Lophiotrema nucula TaxID=690887 RepID=A0A6A5Z443_9PLEO|nr:hypothetical protein BDV96DRAFT_118510 [Lophiotrema nucula]
MAFRPLQPAPMEQEQASQPQSRPLLALKPKRTVTLGACVACRKRKSKCDGSRPVCTCCSQKDTECIYELGPNEKPSQAMKRKNEEMQGELTNLRQLYDFLRLRPEQEALEILRRIRSNPPDTSPALRIQELADFVRHGDLLIQPPYSTPPQNQQEHLTLPPLRLALDSSSSDDNSFPGTLSSFTNGVLSIGAEGPTTQRRRHASDADVSARSESQGPLPRPTSISIDAIIHDNSTSCTSESADSRLDAARYWTSVTSDRNIIVSLMTAWHTWEYKYFHFLDWDIFLEDLVARRNDFCSDLLVNALLASASFQTSMVKERSRPFADNILTLFYKEARRLWEDGEGEASLPRLQAAMLLWLVLGKHGRDKVGHTFLLEACRIARELNLFRLLPPNVLPKPSTVSLTKTERVRSVTAWALFNFQLSLSFTYSFPAIIKMQPPLPVPYEDSTDSETLFRSECARHVIMLDCANILVDADGSVLDVPPKPEVVEVLVLRLKSWWDSRPVSLNPSDHPSPENLLSAMHYHVCLIRIAQPFLGRDSTPERIRAYHGRARSIASTSMKELRRLIALHDSRHGWSSCIPYVLDPIMMCSFGTLEEIVHDERSLTPRERSEPYEGLMTCLRALSGLSYFIFYAQPLFRLATQTCLTLGIQLPVEAMKTLNHYTSEEWTKNAASLVSSQYVAGFAKTAMGIEMDAVISQWEALSVGHSSVELPTRTTSRCGQRLQGR